MIRVFRFTFYTYAGYWFTGSGMVGTCAHRFSIQT
jgi:hypothetical protein